MTSDIFHYMVIMVVAGVLNTILGFYAYLKRKTFNGSTIFLLISLCSAIYTFGHAFELASYELEMIISWVYVQYIGMPYLAPLSMLLVMVYTGMDKFIVKKNVILIFIIPALTTIIVLTNHIHHFFYQSIYIRNDGTSLIDFTIGPWYIVHGSYTFASLLVGGIFIISYWRQTKTTYWKQNTVMLLALYLPMLTSFLYLIGLTPHGMDPVPVVMSVTAALYIWAFQSTNLLKLAPIARGLIFDTMRDGVIVLDAKQRIVDFNQSAKALFHNVNNQSIGMPIYSIWKANEIPFQKVMNLNYTTEFEIEWSGNCAYYQIRSSPVYKKNREFVGSTIVILDITEQRRLQEKLEKLAYIDGLTEILNRSAFIEQTKKCLQQNDRTKQSTSIILFDIDHFKQINDTYGHQIGDEVIRHVVTICEQHLKPGDLFGRYGGEEFVICLPQQCLLQAEAIVEKIRKCIETTPLASSKEISVTASFGITEAACDASIEELLHRADEALYASKHHGRNTIHIYRDGEICLSGVH
ncbi:histidine kinase N-terminal 7TM domain-containing diguanylate cyclase [Metabacillus malikii]|uniref:Diguanylate cyclase (GGDEF)-like protein/PAS domain S-box-containing protein n=1 Tax=Metabacillus malikii TaxID=1504265 RepID=A0ABT9ZC55_9BACI|nr:histidine kinase N-terminal 7TM domain-containing protein [Metabacillus malikii]MDQ0229831.1 diguanylate cyclase (GGDEF)-like protein/PAS domain S-box-containing protein [Metabacillus malikii]